MEHLLFKKLAKLKYAGKTFENVDEFCKNNNQRLLEAGIYIYIYIYKYIRGTNKTNTGKQLLVSCLHIHQAYNM